jgi:5-methylcytosine-specific restriction endonuclease McrA
MGKYKLRICFQCEKQVKSSNAICRNCKRRNNRIKIIEFFGSKCLKCGSSENLTFHHLNPKEKQFNILGGSTRPKWTRLLIEAKKCILVCRKCHDKIEGYI